MSRASETVLNLENMRSEMICTVWLELSGTRTGPRSTVRQPTLRADVHKEADLRPFDRVTNQSEKVGANASISTRYRLSVCPRRTRTRANC